ncbi:gpr1 fun34-class plasma membrane protein [Physcia stellaris]|nr:gpr1 fun34-class plasma membrane protein [Physcia stellaris]
MSNNHESSEDLPLEKDFSRHAGANGTGTGQGLNPYDVNNGGEHLGDNEHPDHALRRIRTAGSISISPELFEKLYLSPENRVKGDLRKTFGNPTPLALIGFLLSLTPLSCDLMGWRGAGGNGAASTGVFFFFGCMLMILGAVGEWIVGNTFPFVVFGTFGSFWGAFGATLVPWYNAYGSYVTDPTVAATQNGNPGNPAGLMAPAFNSSFAFFQIFMVCSLRTNMVFVLIFLTLVFAFSCLAGAYFNLALYYENNMNLSASVTASRLVVAGGAFAFVTCLAGWWIFFAILLASVDFPLAIPVGDLSTMIKGASERRDGGAGEAV